MDITNNLKTFSQAMRVSCEIPGEGSVITTGDEQLHTGLLDDYLVNINNINPYRTVHLDPSSISCTEGEEANPGNELIDSCSKLSNPFTGGPGAMSVLGDKYNETGIYEIVSSLCPTTLPDSSAVNSHTSSLVPPTTVYRCGGCGCLFTTIAWLHDHLQDHETGGSYHYDHHSRTAFPKHDTVCSGTQTDKLDEDNSLDRLTVNTLSCLYDHENIISDSRSSDCKVKDEPVEEIDIKKVDKVDADVIPYREVKVDIDKLSVGKTSDVDSDATVDEDIESYINLKQFSETEAKETGCDVDSDEQCRTVRKVDRSDADISSNGFEAGGDNILEARRKNKDQGFRKSKCEGETDENKINTKLQEKNDKERNSHRKKVRKLCIQKSTSVKCKHCANVFSLQAHLKIHMKEVHGVEDFYLRKKKPVQCTQCDKTFPFLIRLKKHMKEEHHMDKCYECKICDEKFKSLSALSQHNKQTHKKSFKCLLCEKELSSAKTLADHMFGHTGMKPYTCDTCGKTFRNNGQLNFHVKQYHEEVPYQQCEYCGKTFICRYRIREHIKYCLGVKPHKCDFCGKGFIRTAQLQQHRRVHTGEKPYVCDVCGLKMANLSSLQKHKRIHTGERPYKCDVCQQTFLAKTTLTDHERIHTQDKRFTCTFCSRSFIKKWNLKTHLRQHTGETPYKCDVCGQGFKQNVLLKTHMQSHSKAVLPPVI